MLIRGWGVGLHAEWKHGECDKKKQIITMVQICCARFGCAGAASRSTAARGTGCRPNSAVGVVHD